MQVATRKPNFFLDFSAVLTHARPAGVSMLRHILKCTRGILVLRTLMLSFGRCTMGREAAIFVGGEAKM
jgi:hypothetical protein